MIDYQQQQRVRGAMSTQQVLTTEQQLSHVRAVFQRTAAKAAELEVICEEQALVIAQQAARIAELETKLAPENPPARAAEGDTTETTPMSDGSAVTPFRPRAKRSRSRGLVPDVGEERTAADPLGTPLPESGA